MTLGVIAFERAMGSNVVGNSLTFSASASVGETVFVFYAHNAGGSPSGVSDSAGNTWVLAEQAAFNSRAILYYSHITSPIAGGGVTFSVTGVATLYRLSAYAFSGLDIAGTFDQRNNAGANVSGTAVQVTLGTTTLADELIVASLCASGTTSFTPLAGYTELFDISGGPTASGIYRIVTATGVYTPGSTRAVSGAWGIAAASFKRGPFNSNKRNQVVMI